MAEYFIAKLLNYNRSLLDLMNNKSLKICGSKDARLSLIVSVAKLNSCSASKLLAGGVKTRIEDFDSFGNRS